MSQEKDSLRVKFSYTKRGCVGLASSGRGDKKPPFMAVMNAV